MPQEKVTLVGLNYLRALAVLAVVLFHAHYFRYGYLGVDLFFVLSGFLVGGPLANRYLAGEPMQITNFYMKRMTKILPSLWALLFVGGGLAWYLYSVSHPDHLLRSEDIWSYLLFYVNYRHQGPPMSPIFAHLWSLCVEEHFYLLLPILFLGLRSSKRLGLINLVKFIGLGIAGINVLRVTLGLFWPGVFDNVYKSHSRLDALFWGILSALVMNRIVNRRIVFGGSGFELRNVHIFTLGILLLFFFVTIDCYVFPHSIYEQVFLHGLAPIAFSLIVVGSAQFKFKYFKFLESISASSYNTYLWHPLALPFIREKYGVGLNGLLVYVMTSLFLGFIATALFEKPGLKLRNRSLIANSAITKIVPLSKTNVRGT